MLTMIEVNIQACFKSIIHQNERNESNRIGTERNGTERNGTERNGTERNGTERNRTSLGSIQSLGKLIQTHKSNSEKLGNGTMPYHCY